MNNRPRTPAATGADEIKAQPLRRGSLLDALLNRIRKKPRKKEKNIYPLF